ncbi:MAG: dockerin type I domain-containing protein, partial [Planctomycetota bacterium]
MKATLTTAAALILFGTTTGISAQNAERFGGPAMQAGEQEREVQRERKGQKGPRLSKAAMLERFDTDGDGELSEAERATAKETFKAKREQMKARLLERFDDNGDGELDEAERAALRETVGPMLKERGKRGRPGQRHMHKIALERFDADEDGTLNDTEKAAAKAHFQQKKAAMVERFDADGDGQLTGDERKAAREHHREQRQLDANRDGNVNATDAQVITERFAAGERIPDINRDGVQDASDVAELLRRIGSYE